MNLKLNDKRIEILTAYLFLAPFLILWAIWFLAPAIQGLLMSFQEFSYIFPNKNQYIGFENYIRLFKDPYFHMAFKNTFTMVFWAVPIQSFIALILAVILDGSISGRGVYRTIYYAPYIISPIAVATVFMYFFVKGTPITKFFTFFGIENVTWFANMQLALPFIIIIYIWQQIGFYIVIYLSGLQGVSKSTYEACDIDGASTVQKFIYITIPMLKPVIFLTLTYGMIQAFQMFDQIAAVSRSNPLGSPAGATSTMVTFFYQQSFEYYDMGYGSAAAITLFLIIFIVAMVQKVIVGSDEA